MATVVTRPSGPSGPTGSLRRRRLVGAGALLVLALVGVGALGGAVGTRTAPRALPDTLVGLPVQQGGPAAAVADDLTATLGAEPSVSDVSVGVYGEQGRVVVVLALTPRDPLTQEAGDVLTSQVLGAAGPRRGRTDDVLTGSSDDGRATVTCSTPRPDAATCVSVEPDAALVVLTTGTVTDPVELTRAVRDELAEAARS